MMEKKSGWVLLGGVALLVAACGGGGGDSSKATGFKDVKSLANALEAPTGKVQPETAVGVAKEFQVSMNGMSQNPAAGSRQKELAQSQSATVDCEAGGSYTVHVNVDGDAADITAQYNNCDMGTDCTINGSLASFGSKMGDWSSCVSYDLDISCKEAAASMRAAFSGCLGESGTFEYLVDYAGETYRVTGSYNNGNGTLNITGANGSWTCTYQNDAGSCESSAGDSFEFTADSGKKKNDLEDALDEI